MAWWWLIVAAAVADPVSEPVPQADGATADAPIGGAAAAEAPTAEGARRPPVTFAFGEGVTFRSEDDRFSLRIRGRVQLLATLGHDGADEETPTDVGFQIRRARLAFSGHFFDRRLGYTVELAFAPRDLESDLPSPLLDAYLTWVPLRDLNVRAGQMKVPFSRERVISSSALQLVDRSIVNGELSLDRDVGVSLFSNDVGGLGGRLGYAVGVFGGEGRNRFGQGAGLLYVARLQVQPLGPFPDATIQADLSRDRRARLSVGGAVAFEDEARRERSTHGAFFEADPHDSLHGTADVHFKVAGLSLLTEFLWRRFLPAEREQVVDGEAIEQLTGSGLGWFVQAGYLTPIRLEIAARWAELHPLAGVATVLTRTREGTVGLSWYPFDHDLKLQADYGFRFEDGLDGPVGHTARVQSQVYF